MINNRVQLILGRQNVQKALSQQGLVAIGNKPQVWVGCGKGLGRTGQVKKAGWFGRSVTLLGIKLNRGSVIDFINALVNKINEQCLLDVILKPLDKGNVFKGGASDIEINQLFNDICKKMENIDVLKDLGKSRETPLSYRF